MSTSFAGGTDNLDYGSGWNGSIGTLAFWMLTTQATANVAVATLWSSTSRNGIGMILNGSANKITVLGYSSTSPAKITLVSLTSLNDGNPHHVAFNFNTASGGANSLYIDGALEASGNSTGAWSIGGSGTPLRLGKSVDSFWAPYVGNLWDVAQWLGSQLSSNDIAALAKGFSPKQVMPSALKAFIPLTRAQRELRTGVVPTVTGTTVAAQGRELGGAV